MRSSLAQSLSGGLLFTTKSAVCNRASSSSGTLAWATAGLREAHAYFLAQGLHNNKKRLPCLKHNCEHYLLGVVLEVAVHAWKLV